MYLAELDTGKYVIRALADNEDEARRLIHKGFLAYYEEEIKAGQLYAFEGKPTLSDLEEYYGVNTHWMNAGSVYHEDVEIKI